MVLFRNGVSTSPLATVKGTASGLGNSTVSGGPPPFFSGFGYAHCHGQGPPRSGISCGFTFSVCRRLRVQREAEILDVRAQGLEVPEDFISPLPWEDKREILAAVQVALHQKCLATQVGPAGLEPATVGL